MQPTAPFRPLFTLVLLATTAFTPAAWAAIPVVDPELRIALRKAAAESESFPDRFEAEVWLADMSRRLTYRVPDSQYRIDLLKAVHYEATRVGLMPELVLAVIDIESAFNPYAISSAGAQGLMQVMPFWLKEIGRPTDNLFRLQTNLRFGCTILKFYLDKENQNLFAALKRYNGTRENRYSLKVDKLLRTRWYRQ
ncbi:MAG TPA: transglycosylase SLT domain-containing protein [Burkholderiales bacterium]|nr:transglycosylase SLT domain-containing protein [Burkholderiales bacterium]